MTPDHLNRQIETVRQRLAAWRQRVAAAGMDAPTRQALEELDATLKELGVTAGELHSRNEQEPHESERFARATIDALSAHICVLDENGIILAVNQAWRVFAEANPPITQNVVEGANYLAVCDAASGEDADIAHAFAAGLRAVIQGERDEFSLEYPCHSPTVQRWFNGRVTRLPAPGLTQVVIAHENITERKLAETALRESETQFRTLAQVAPAGIYVTDAHGQFVYTNPCWREMAGLAPEQALGKGWVQGLHPDDRERTVTAWHNLVQSGGQWELEYRFQTPEGKTTWVLGQAAPLRDGRSPQGQVTGYVGINLDITARKQMEAMLRASEEQYRRIVETAREGIWIMDAGGKTTFVNQRMMDMLGYMAGEMLSAPLFAFVDEKEYARAAALLERRRQGIAEQYEFKFRRRDGTDLWAIVETTPITDEHGKYNGALAMVTDITERKRAEEALRESEELYRQTITSISDTVFLTDDHGHFILVCPNVDLTFGWSADEAMAMGNLRSLIGASPFIPDELEGELRNVEWEILDKSGQPHSVLVHIKRVHIGAATRLYTCRDITERKRAEKALQESEERFRCLSEASFEGIAFHDEGKIIDANQTFATMFGYSLSEMIGKDMLDFATPELREAALRHIRTGSEEPYEGVAIRKNGSTFPVQVRGKNAVFIGRSVRLVAVRDITERKRAEEALHESEQRYRTISELTSDFAGAFRIEMDGTILREWLTGAYSRITGFDLGELDTHGFWITLVHPDDMPAAVRHLRTLFSGQPDVCELRIVTASGQVRWLSNYGRPVWDAAQGRVIRIYSASQDITGRKRAEEALRERNAELALLNRAGQAFSSTLDLDTVIHTVLDEMRQLFQVVACSIWLCDPDTGELVCQQSVGPQSELVSGWRLAPGQGVAGWAVRASESVIVEDAPSDPRHHREVDLRTGLDLRSILAVPLRAGQRVTGVIEMVDNQAGRFKAANVTLLEALAAEAGLAIENARLYGQVQRENMERRLAVDALRESEATARALLESPVDSILLVNLDGIILDTNQTFAQSMGRRVDELIGRCVYDFLPPELAASRRAHVAEVVHRGAPIRFEDERTGVQLDQSAHPIFDAEGQVTRIAIIARDITERKQMENTIQSQAARAGALADLSRALAEVGHDYHAVLNMVAERISTLVGGACVIRLVSDDGQWLDPVVIAHPDPAAAARIRDLVASDRHPVDEIQAPVMQAASPVPMSLPAEEQLRQSVEPQAWPFVKGLIERGVLLVPLRVRSRVIGILAVLRDQPGLPYTADDQAFLQNLADRAALAIADAQLFDQVHRQREQLRALTARLAEAEEAERRRLARELHDRVGQSLTALSINLNIIGSQLPRGASAVQARLRLADSQRLVEETVEHTRDVMADLRPAVLDDYGLLAALRWYAGRFSGHTTVDMQVEGHEFSPRLPQAVETTLFRITQEALNNVTRHAQATHAMVRLEVEGDLAQLIIADDGVGFDLAAERQPGEQPAWGLISMQERAEAVGGRLRVESAPGQGTRVIVEAPR